MILLLLLACSPTPPVCGSLDKPHTSPECPCMDYAVGVPAAGWGSVSCRPDQDGEVIRGPEVVVRGSSETPVLVCRCRR